MSTIQISMTEDVIVTGQDERHMPWRFHIQGYGNLYLYDLYTADLDLKDYEDILLLVSTGGSGLAPTTHLITLLFDTSGRPIPFEADGYWRHDEQSMTGLVDLDNNEKDDILFTIETQQGETIACSPVSWYASFAVVVDTERREIASLSAREHTVKTLLDEIIAQHYEVAVYGQRRAD